MPPGAESALLHRPETRTAGRLCPGLRRGQAARLDRPPAGAGPYLANGALRTSAGVPGLLDCRSGSIRAGMTLLESSRAVTDQEQEDAAPEDKDGPKDEDDARLG